MGVNEIKQILKAYDLAQVANEPCVLATVTFVEGSSYRRAGARMLVGADGTWIGCVSGGCLERDLLRKAAFVLAKNEPMLIAYDTREDTDQDSTEEKFEEFRIEGAGLGCNGYIEILVEPILAEVKHPVLEKLKTWMSERKNGGVILLPKLNLRAQIFVEQSTEENKFTGLENFSDEVQSQILRAWDLSNGDRKAIGKDILGEKPLRILMETFAPSTQVFLFGAGYDAVTTATLAVELGHEVHVVDVRSAVPIPRSAFKGIQNYTQCEPEEISKKVKMDEHSIAVLMTHHAEDDQILLPQILAANPAYVGMLGPKIRGERLIEEYESRGLLLSEDARSALHYPAGLDIGAETPSEIALSIFAEVNAVLKNRAGGLLRERAGPIHVREVS
jgi:xanthine dehydrogenase accessory factor